jgi:hypothetical protein
MTNNEISLRKNLCDVCEHLVGEVTPTCNLCACPVLYMVSINSNKCPINKWNSIELEDNI